MRFLLIIFLSLFFGLVGFTQEALTGLQFNPMVKAKAGDLKRMSYLATGLDTIPVTIPFFDDFSSNGVFPSSKRWIDHFAFENDDLPVFPVNLGAMTLDAINDSGNMYPNAVPGPMNFIADYLTSRYIRLDSVFSPVPRALTLADSVYLSFFYQPQGRGKAPQKNDSLILEFLVVPAHDSITQDDTIPVPDLWRKMWFANGMPLDTFFLRNNKWFVQVMVPVKDPAFFKNKFRFRFFNYVSLAGSSEPSWQSNAAQWNLDNVYLNIGRSRYDTIYPELRFIYRPPSILHRYASMPYTQYSDDPTNEIRDTLDILMSNRDIIPHMSSYNYYITNPNSSFSKSYNGGNYNIQPYFNVPYVTYQKFAHPAVPFLIPVSQADSAIFLMKHVLNPLVPGSVPGDTMQAYQRFYNYFAYDDGTPEASYGLSPAGSKLAYRFRLNKSPDTLRAVRMYFNRTLSNASKQFFYLCVWNDNAGKPGDTIYSELVMPEYADSINKFVTYHLFPPLQVTGTFYVGWIQTTGDNLSIGFDSYNNSQNEIFWNSAGVWNNSTFAGSLMIRPVIGKPIPLGISDRVSRNLKITVFPNPCTTNMMSVRFPELTDNNEISKGCTMIIYDLIGNIRVNTEFRQVTDVSSLANGLYFLEVRNRSGIRVGSTKFIISR
ncbi:MAG: T9SS type A sorting domain-containing protein [Bacteroidales bacterium]|nr:T9SS type A sorting domain-containing protein [Bacteroidales bacterium]